MRLGQAVRGVLGGIIISTVFASAAHAGCADITAGTGQVRLFPTAYGDDSPSIVGLWQVTFISEGNNVQPFLIPDGAPLDQGYAQWHSDGTEIMNSGRDPVTSNFCLGVWTTVGRQTYRLNHFAISWDNTGKFCTPVAPATNCMVGPANIRELVTLNRRGDKYTGSVTIDQYDTNQHLMFRLTGNIAATRINP
jgi:hypothetical protein